MLYEVITAFTACSVMNSPLDINLPEAAIPSKEYILLFNIGRDNSSSFLLFFRITSYNVCYTKLLRIRIIRTPEDEITVDATGKKNGRGAYICNSQECLAKAVKHKGLERSLKISIPAEIYASLEKELNEIEEK